MPEVVCLNPAYSTTQLLTTGVPDLKHTSEDKFESVLFLHGGEGRKGEGGLRSQGYFKVHQSEKPLITVITVVYNGQDLLEETINSVINQTYDNLEYIIIDGASSDGTLEIIKKYEDKIDYWVSEPDAGIYDAMNKGIKLASGEWLNFMNSGDSFFSLDIVASVFKNHALEGIDFIYSNTLLDGKRIHFADIGKNKIIHQSLIYRKDMHHKVDLYMVHKGLYLSDYIFFLLCKKYNWLKVDGIISNYSTAGKYEKFLDHVQQRTAVDLLFGNIHRGWAGFKLMISPYYWFFKKVQIFLVKKLGF